MYDLYKEETLTRLESSLEQLDIQSGHLTQKHGNELLIQFAKMDQLYLGMDQSHQICTNAMNFVRTVTSTPDLSHFIDLREQYLITLSLKDFHDSIHEWIERFEEMKNQQHSSSLTEQARIYKELKQQLESFSECTAFSDVYQYAMNQHLRMLKDGLETSLTRQAFSFDPKEFRDIYQALELFDLTDKITRIHWKDMIIDQCQISIFSFLEQHNLISQTLHHAFSIIPESIYIEGFIILTRIIVQGLGCFQSMLDYFDQGTTATESSIVQSLLISKSTLYKDDIEPIIIDYLTIHPWNRFTIQTLKGVVSTILDTIHQIHSFSVDTIALEMCLSDCQNNYLERFHNTKLEQIITLLSNEPWRPLQISNTWNEMIKEHIRSISSIDESIIDNTKNCITLSNLFEWILQYYQCFLIFKSESVLDKLVQLIEFYIFTICYFFLKDIPNDILFPTSIHMRGHIKLFLDEMCSRYLNKTLSIDDGLDLVDSRELSINILPILNSCVDDLNSPVTLYGLSSRFVAIDTLKSLYDFVKWFHHLLIESNNVDIESLDKWNHITNNILLPLPELFLRGLTYLWMPNIEKIPKRIKRIGDWKKMPKHGNDLALPTEPHQFVKELIQDLTIFNQRLEAVLENFQSPLLHTMWLVIIERIMMDGLLRGFVNIKNCSEYGRMMMMIDVQELNIKLNQFSMIR